MSTNQIVSRFPFEPHIVDMPPQQQYVIRNLWNAIADVQGAVPILKTQIDGNKSAITNATNTINTFTSTENVTPPASPTIGFVNDQSGNTTYSTTQADYGKFIILDDASPVAVSLTDAPVIQLPWYAFFVNLGAGTATLTPASGTISYYGNISSGSMPITQGLFSIVGYDGTNFWACSIPIATSLTFGAVKPDNSTITISGGVISAVAGGDFTQSFMLMGG